VNAGRGALWVTLLLPGVATAQDAHYWTNQYGTRAELLGGLVVGSVVDLSATYYNPGALAHVSQPTLMLTTDAWQLISITLDIGADDAFDQTSTRFRAAPRIFAVQISSKESDNRLAISFLTRHDFEIDVKAGRVTPRDSPIDGTVGQAFSGESAGRAGLSEGWAGFTWARPISDRVGVGATGYIALRSQQRRRQLTASVVDSTGVGTSLTDFDDLSYWNLRTLAKVGVQFDFSPLQLGVTVTTPSLNLFGDGETRVNRALVNSDTSGGTLDRAELEANIQKGISSTYKSPLGIAFGAEYDFGRTALFVTGEWFNGVDRYAILDAASFVGQTSGDTLSVDVLQELESVVNVGIGLEHVLSTRVRLYGAVFTDRTAFGSEATDPLAVATWDILHFTGGAGFRVGTIDLTIGASYGHGDGEALPIDFLDQATDVTGTYRSLKLIFGLQLAF